MTVFSILFFGAAYACGELVGPWGDFVSSKYRFKLFKEVSANHLSLMSYLRQRFGNDIPDEAPAIEGLTDTDVQRIYQQMHDFLKLTNEQARVLLPKSQAEAALCANLCGFVILFVLFSVAWLAARSVSGLAIPSIPWKLIFLLALGAAVAVRAGQFRSRRLIQRQFSFLALVKEGEQGKEAGVFQQARPLELQGEKVRAVPGSGPSPPAAA